MAKKKKIKLPNPYPCNRKVRPKFVGVSPAAFMPARARQVYAMLSSAAATGANASFVVDELPMTVNHSKNRVRGVSKAGKAFMSEALKPEVYAFRKKVKAALDAKGSWKPRGLTAALVLLADPRWITQELTVRAGDVDNRIKPLLDAIKEGTGVPDELHWELYVFKVVAREQKTVVFLFDLGDVVESHG